MKLEHFGMAEPGDCRVVFSAAAEELEAAVQAEKAAPDAPQDEDDLLTAAVVGSEGVLPVPLCVPVGKLVIHLGFRRPELFFLRHQQQPHPAAQFALGLGVEPGSEFFHGLALHL